MSRAAGGQAGTGARRGRLRGFWLTAGLAQTVSAAYAAWTGRPMEAMFLLVAGVGLSLELGRLWERLPTVIERSLVDTLHGWIAFLTWHAGLLLTAAAWAGAVPAGWPAGVGPFLMLTSTFLLADHLGSAIWRSGRWRARPIQRAIVLLVPAGVCLGVAALLLSLSFRPDALQGLRDVALSLLVFGALVPAGVAVFGLPHPRVLLHAPDRPTDALGRLQGR